MQMLQYNEAENVELLKRLPVRLRVAFALLSAFRILPMYQRFHHRTGRGDASALEAIVERLWRDITNAPMSTDEVKTDAEQCMELVPSEEDGWDEETQPSAEDAAAAVAYALRARQTGDPQEAAWAGRRVYEAIDRYVNSKTSGLVADPDDELAILSHPLVQAELGRQRRDLHELLEIDRANLSETKLAQLRERSLREAAGFFTRRS